MKNKTERENVDVYQIVTDRIIELLEKGTVPWQKPWVGGEFQAPKNLTSGKAYRGVNVLLLGCSGFSSPYWVSYKQAQDRGGQVRKGEASSLVTFWKMFEKVESGEKKTIPMLRYYRVFNVEQCDGLEYPQEQRQEMTFNPIEEAEKIVKAMPKAPTITHSEQSAFYERGGDRVNMPKRETFSKSEDYYSVLFHELTHSTGHENRLGRLQNSFSRFGDSNYAKEELIAEIGASYLSNTAGIVDRTIDNSASYIQSWISKLKNDRKLIVGASSKAQEAVEFILGKGKGE
jgi:hypothetical protein